LKLVDTLYKQHEIEQKLPSPHQLKGKILLKAKYVDPQSSSDSEESSPNSELEEIMTDTRKYIKEKRFSRPLSTSPRPSSSTGSKRVIKSYILYF